MKKSKTKRARKDRREFLKGMAVAGGAVTVAAAVPQAVAGAAQTPDLKAPGGKGYHVTQHILDYYKTAAM